MILPNAQQHIDIVLTTVQTQIPYLVQHGWNSDYNIQITGRQFYTDQDLQGWSQQAMVTDRTDGLHIAVDGMWKCPYEFRQYVVKIMKDLRPVLDGQPA